MGDESSTTRTPQNWWDYTFNPSSWLMQHNPNNNINTSCCDQEDDVISLSANSSSFTNLSDGFSVDESSHHQPVVDSTVPPSSYVCIGDRHSSDNNLWTNVLIQDVKENYLDGLSDRSSISLSGSRIFGEPSGACDYLKKMDTTNTWELKNSNSSLINNFNKYLNLGFVDNNFTNEGNRLANKLSSIVSNNSSFDSQPSLISLNSSSFDQYLINTDICANVTPSMKMTSDLNHSFYGHDINVNISNRGNDEFEPTLGSLARRSFNGKYYEGLSGSQCTNGRSFDENDAVLRSQVSSKPLVDSYACKPSYKKQRPYVTSMVKGKNNGKDGNSNEGSKKKRFEDNNSETIVIKKPKQENSTASSIKMQPPKMKLGDKITSLQQIVSPFGKTDTASVLFEAIGYIKFLQEQVQLLSNPYMKANPSKDPWRNMEWNERGDKRHDLKSKGLCLVPISSTPQIYSENAGSEYWTPTYRGCFYR